jgi:molecular chaperone GrpE
MAKKKFNEEGHKKEAKGSEHKVRDKEEAIDQAEDINQKEKAQPEESDMASVREAELLEKLAEMQDRYLRLSAEFDNYRKRTLKEKIDLTKTASESVLLKILPVFDDFERGVQLMESSTDSNAMHEGINLIYSKFRNFLEQNGVKEIEAMNHDFNVDMHDAVTKVPAPDEALKGKVVAVLEKGYLLNEKVIRFSKVVVGE